MPFHRTVPGRHIGAALRIRGSELSIAEVTRELGVAPSLAQTQWEMRPRNHGVPVLCPWPSDVWGLDSRPGVESQDVEEHIEWLLDRIEPSKTSFLRIVAKPEVNADLFVLWISATGQGGPRVEPDVLARLGAFNLALEMDVYHDSLEHEEEDEEAY
ncbi:MAG: DUF4279 domain-containing protein [Chloroflexota bacterium]